MTKEHWQIIAAMVMAACGLVVSLVAMDDSRSYQRQFRSVIPLVRAEVDSIRPLIVVLQSNDMHIGAALNFHNQYIRGIDLYLSTNSILHPTNRP